MDLFASQYKTVASSVTKKVMGDYDDPLPGVVAGSIVTNGNLTEDIVSYFSNGYFNRAEKFYKYGRDNYVRGLPQMLYQEYNIDYQEIRRILREITGNKVQLIYAFLNTDYINHYIMQYLQDVRHIDPVTKIIGVDPPGAIEEGWLIYDSYTVALDQMSANIKYNYNIFGSFTETIPLPYKDRVVYQVQYQELDETNALINAPVLWTYSMGEGTYINLDTISNISGSPESRFYPAIPFYENKTQIGNPANAGTELYEDSKDLVEILGFKYEDLVSALAEGTEESIGKDKGLYAYLYLGAEVTAGILPNYATATNDEKIAHWKINQATINYLVDFFTKESLLADYDKYQFDRYDFTKSYIIGPSVNYISIIDGHFGLLYSFYFADVRRVNGVIGDIGFCTSSITPQETGIKYSTILGEATSNVINTTRLFYRRQESSTVYVEVEVCGLTQNTYVFDNTSAVTYANMFNAEDPTIMTIPLDRNLVRNQPATKRNRLIHASMCFVFTAYQIIEIEWYQQPFWISVFTMIAIILSVPSGGSSFSWASLLTVAGLTAAAYALLIAYLKYIVFKEITEFISKKFGIEVAFIVSAVLMTYGRLGKSGSLNGLPFASQLMNVGVSVWNASKQELIEQAQQVEEDYAKTKAEIDKLNDELSRAQQLLDTNTNLNPALFINPLPDLVWGESADSFITTRKEGASLGVMSLQAPSQYVDLMVTLPTINDTINNRSGDNDGGL